MVFPKRGHAPANLPHVPRRRGRPEILDDSEFPKGKFQRAKLRSGDHDHRLFRPARPASSHVLQTGLRPHVQVQHNDRRAPRRTVARDVRRTCTGGDSHGDPLGRLPQQLPFEFRLPMRRRFTNDDVHHALSMASSTIGKRRRTARFGVDFGVQAMPFRRTSSTDDAKTQRRTEIHHRPHRPSCAPAPIVGSGRAMFTDRGRPPGNFPFNSPSVFVGRRTVTERRV